MSLEQLFSQLPSEVPGRLLREVLTTPEDVATVLTEVLVPGSQFGKITGLTPADISEATARGSQLQVILQTLDTNFHGVIQGILSKLEETPPNISIASLSQFVSAIPVAEEFFDECCNSSNLELQKQLVTHLALLNPQHGAVDMTRFAGTPIMASDTNTRRSILYFSCFSRLEVVTVAHLQANRTMAGEVASLFDKDYRSVPEYVVCACISLLVSPVSSQTAETSSVISVLLESLLIQLLDINSPYLVTLFEEYVKVGRSKVAQFLVSYYERRTSDLTSLKVAQLATATDVLADVVNLLPFQEALNVAMDGTKFGYDGLAQFVRGNLNSDENVLQLLIFLENCNFQRESRPLEGMFTLLELLSSSKIPPQHVERFKAAQAQTIQAFPRLINFNTGHDEAILANAKVGPFFPVQVEQEMKMAYQKMYNKQCDIKEVISMLQQMKESDSPHDQDVFACMIHSLVDEYRFFPEYPVDALATTSVLFGSMILFNLVQGNTLSIGLRYILESARQPVDSNMFKFALQALLAMRVRLPEFPKYCSLLAEIPALASRTELNLSTTPIQPMQPIQPPLQEESSFKSIHCSAVGGFSCPNEEVSDRILFMINNLSFENLDKNGKEIASLLDTPFLGWFASYLVKERVRSEPNFHELYDKLCQKIGRRVDRFIEEVTMAHVVLLTNKAYNDQLSSSEKTHLKNMALWVGRITLSRDKPLKHKHIAIKMLLVEAHDEGKLEIVIPFVCKILSQAVHSTIFQNPNPWLLGNLQVLKELYEVSHLSLNLRFEIELLFNALKVKEVEPSNVVRTHSPNDVAKSAEVTRQVAQVTRQVSEMAVSPPPMFADLVGDSVWVTHPNLRRLLQTAMTKSVASVLPVIVERTNSIALGTAMSLVMKDFALEHDESKIRHAAHVVSTSLCQNLSLASVREPLRESIQQNLLSIAQLDAASLNAVPIAVNDNIHLASELIQKASMDRISQEVDEAVSEVIRHNSLEKNVSRYALQLPEPLGLRPNGVSPAQFAIYENFNGKETVAQSPETQLTQLMHQLFEAAKSQSSSLKTVISAILNVVSTNQELLALRAAQNAVQLLFTQCDTPLSKEALVFLLEKLCEMSPSTAKDVTWWLVHAQDERKYHADVMATLVKMDLVSAAELDRPLSLIVGTSESASEFVASLVTSLVTSNCVMKSQFVYSIEAMRKCSSASLSEIDSHSVPTTSEESKLAYTFGEWTKLVSHTRGDPDATLWKERFVNSIDLDVANLIRLATQMSVSAFMQNQSDFACCDALAELMVYADLNVCLSIVTLVLVAEHEKGANSFNQRPFFRIFSTLLAQPSVSPIVIAETLIVLQPVVCPGFTFAWISLVSHRMFLPKILESNEGSAKFVSLLLALFKFQNIQKSSEIVNVVFKGITRILALLLHDFPDFLVNHHYVLSTAIPSHYTQLRNIVLSAFPLQMTLPDPFESFESSDPPIMAFNPALDLTARNARKFIDNYLRIPSSIKSILTTLECDSSDATYDARLVNALVIHVGVSATQNAHFTPSSTHVSLISAILQEDIVELQSLVLDAVANQLRYPNSLTSWCSQLMLHLFQTGSGDVQQIIARILLERVLANKPHPWGITHTFKKLVTESSLFEMPFVRATPEIEKLFETLQNNAIGVH